MGTHPKSKFGKLWSSAAILICFSLAVLPARMSARQVILRLKNGDRLSGQILTESTNQVVLSNAFYGKITIPIAEIESRETLPDPVEPPPAAKTSPAPTAKAESEPTAQKTVEPAPAVIPGTNAPPAEPSSGGAELGPPAPAKPKEIEPANPEAAPIASTPNYWKHDVQFGLNLRYSTRDQQEYLFIARSTYAKPPFRHIFDYNFAYGKTEGELSANKMSGSQKTEWEISKSAYLFNLIGGGYDKVRKIDVQYEISPGFGMELLRSTNYLNMVWKTETGFTFQQQFRSEEERQTTYSLRVAEIFAWRIWENLTADAKIEFFPNLDEVGEYRLRLESNLRYPVTDRLSLNVVLVDLYDSQPPVGVEPNDLQIRSTIGVKF